MQPVANERAHTITNLAAALIPFVLLAFVAPWFFALQSRALVLAGAERDNLA